LKAESRAKKILIIVLAAMILLQCVWYVCAKMLNRRSMILCEKKLSHTIAQAHEFDVNLKEYGKDIGNSQGVFFAQQEVVISTVGFQKIFSQLPESYSLDMRNIATGTPEVFYKDHAPGTKKDRVTIVVLCELFPTDILDFLTNMP